MKKIKFISLMFVMLLLGTGCGIGSSKEVRIVSLSPHITTIIDELGLSDKIVMTDNFSSFENDDEVKKIDAVNLKSEEVVAVEPTVIFVPSYAKGSTNLEPLENLDYQMVYVTGDESIESIYTAINEIATALDVTKDGDKMIEDLKANIEELKKKFANDDKPTVYFEISPSPDTYTAGGNTFINELIEIAGGENIFADKDGYFVPTKEDIIKKNPDIIITNVDYIENPIENITKQAGFDGINAVKNDKVFVVDSNSTSQPSVNVVKAIEEIGEIIENSK